MSGATGILALTEEGHIVVEFSTRIVIEKSSVNDIKAGRAPDIVDTILGALSHQLMPCEAEFQALTGGKADGG